MVWLSLYLLICWFGVGFVEFMVEVDEDFVFYFGFVDFVCMDWVLCIVFDVVDVLLLDFVMLVVLSLDDWVGFVFELYLSV